MISIVLPTYNEAASILETLGRAAAALEGTGEPYELLVIDDSSPDGTADVAEGLSAELPVRVLRRPQRNGLATAVVEGWKAAHGDILGVMDADLQHPPEVLAKLADALRDPSVDVAIASRAGPGGGSADWSRVRRFTSWTARHIALCVLPWTLADVHDPMSGMFMVRAESLAAVTLAPAGYKILLEVLAKAHYRRIAEVAYVFGPRGKGNSKLGKRQTLEYMVHLACLARSTGQLRIWVRYAAVGFSGAAIHLGVLAYLVGRQGWPVWGALPVAVQIALLSNFTWNRLFTFRSLLGGDVTGASLTSQFFHFEVTCAIGSALNLLSTIILLFCGWPFLIAAAAGVVAGGIWNLFFNVPAIWRTSISRRPPDYAALTSETRRVKAL